MGKRNRLPGFGKPLKRAASSVSAPIKGGDGDGDGLEFDGTPLERPVTPKPKVPGSVGAAKINKPKIKKPEPAEKLKMPKQRLIGPILSFKKKPTSATLTDERGDWTPQRQKLHARIVDIYRSRSKGKSDNPTVFFLGGGPASRKSSALEAGLPSLEGSKSAVKLDADEMKEFIPEYQLWRENGAKDAASIVHDESKHINSVVTDALLDDEADIIFDTTGDGNYEGLKSRVRGLRKNGHRVVANYMTTDLELAKKLNEERFKKTGRKVPSHQVEYIHGQVSRVVPQALKDDLFDEFYLYDANNLNKPPRLIAQKKKGEKLEVLDKFAYQRFLKKGIPPKPKKSEAANEKAKKFKLFGFGAKPSKDTEKPPAKLKGFSSYSDSSPKDLEP
jgi:hypothetical protein